MNRKLDNTLSALTASGALLVVSLIVASPLAPGRAAPALVDNGLAGNGLAGNGLATELHAAKALVEVIGSAAGTIESTQKSRSTGTSTRNRRHTRVMPFFSFLPRG